MKATLHISHSDIMGACMDMIRKEFPHFKIENVIVTPKPYNKPNGQQGQTFELEADIVGVQEGSA